MSKSSGFSLGTVILSTAAASKDKKIRILNKIRPKKKLSTYQQIVVEVKTHQTLMSKEEKGNYECLHCKVVDALIKFHQDWEEEQQAMGQH